MNAKTLGWIQIVGALIGGWFGWQEMDWGALTFALLFLLMGIHHLKE